MFVLNDRPHGAPQLACAMALAVPLLHVRLVLWRSLGRQPGELQGGCTVFLLLYFFACEANTTFDWPAVAQA